MSEIPTIEQTDINNGNDINEPLTKPIKEKKPRPPKTQAQLEQFQKVRLKRAESLKQKTITKKIEASKLLLSHGIELPAKPIIQEEKLPAKKQNIKQVLTPTHKDVEEESESDDEPPVIIVKKKKKKKQPKTIIIEESDSESDNESDANQHYINKVKQARHFVSQQNKKSLIKVHKKNDVPNYFVD
jgi:hypothetical protein